jgi:putative ABC transport system substrate-binding protein
MRRRDLITFIGGAVAWPLAVHAQQRPMPVVGFLRSTSREDSTRLITAFQQGLKLGGYVEGENVTIEYRWADNQVNRQPALVADLVNRHVDVIVANQASSAAILATNKTIPFVFVIGGDPIKLGLVSNLSRPGGNVTGLTFLEETVVSKHFQIIRELVPKTAAIAMLNHSAHPGADLLLQDAQDAARVLGVQLEIVNVGNEDRDLEAAFASLTQKNIKALVVPGGAFLLSHRSQIVALAARNSIPAIYADREYVAAGGLLSYGPIQTEAYRGAGIYVSKILKGVKPAELPIDESAKFEFVFNLKAARALGIELPLSLMMQVSETIE